MLTDAIVLLSDDPTALALYRAYVDCFTDPSPLHNRAFGYAHMDFHSAHMLTHTKRERVAAERRIRAMAWETVQQTAPTRKRSS